MRVIYSVGVEFIYPTSSKIIGNFCYNVIRYQPFESQQSKTETNRNRNL